MDLPPDHGLSLIQLFDAARKPWPGLLLHSRTMTWAFRPELVLQHPTDVCPLAVRAGLHPVADPFSDELPDGRLWSFRLPTQRRPAALAGPSMLITIDRAPVITDDWWGMAVSHGGRCRLLVAVCVAFPDDPAARAGVLTEAATDGRIHGATIGVDF